MINPDDMPGVADLVDIQSRKRGKKSTANVGEPSVQTDRANADRFIQQHGNSVRWCPELNNWLVWTGKRWEVDAEKVTACAHDTIRSIYAEAAEELDSDRRTALGNWATSSEKGQRVKFLLDYAKPHLVVRVKGLDADPLLLNVQNGTLDLRTCRLKPHDPEDFITKICPVPYKPKVRRKIWDRFLQEQVEDEEVRDFLQKLAGYLLTGDVGEEVVIFVHGPGRTGKSKFVEAIAHVMGDYAAPVPAELIAVDPRRHISSEDHYAMAGLKGVRLAYSSETEDGKRLNSARLKMLSGGDTVQGRFPYGRFFHFRPSHTLVFISNYKPRVDSDDTATFERLVVLPFERIVPEDQRDTRLGEELRKAGPAILAWAIRGLRRYNKQGSLRPLPLPVRAAVAAYRSEMDFLEEYLEECTIRDPSMEATVPFKNLWQEWVDWSRLNRTPARTKKWFATKLEERGFPKDIGTGGVKIRRGITLRTNSDWSDRCDPHLVDSFHKETNEEFVEKSPQTATSVTRLHPAASPPAAQATPEDLQDSTQEPQREPGCDDDREPGEPWREYANRDDPTGTGSIRPDSSPVVTPDDQENLPS